ncbi:MAG: glycoside hydrolase family 3 protein [Acidimicrobiales bacterium]
MSHSTTVVAAPLHRRRTRMLTLLAVGAVLAGCTGGQSELTAPPSSTSTTAAPTSTTTTTVPTTTTTEPTTTTTIEPAVATLATMTLEQKVGQLLMPVIGGTTADDSGSSLAAVHAGGVIYLGNNITDADQLTALSAGLQDRAVADTGVGLLVAVDQEGGRVVRVRDQVTVLPSARSYDGDVAAAAADATLSGSELRLQGINMVLAPVADLTDSTTSVIGNRSYSVDPLVASAMVSAVVDGYQAAGAASVVKHWPGHGPTEVDSHQSLPTLGISVEQWRAVDRVPFVAALDAGVDAVMVGHLAFPALDPSGDPATISPIVVQQELRDVLGFDGVVMTDALDMGAVDTLGSGELAVRSILAGVDLLLAPTDVEAAAAGLLAAVADGRLTEERIDQSVLRVLRLKAALGLPVGPAPIPPEPGPADTTATEDTTTESTITDTTPEDTTTTTADDTGNTTVTTANDTGDDSGGEGEP